MFSIYFVLKIYCSICSSFRRLRTIIFRSWSDRVGSSSIFSKAFFTRADTCSTYKWFLDAGGIHAARSQPIKRTPSRVQFSKLAISFCLPFPSNVISISLPAKVQLTMFAACKTRSLNLQLEKVQSINVAFSNVIPLISQEENSQLVKTASFLPMPTERKSE